MPSAFASTTTRSRSASNVPRATKSAERTRLPQSSSSARDVPGARPADSVTRPTSPHALGDERCGLRERLAFGEQRALLLRERGLALVDPVRAPRGRRRACRVTVAASLRARSSSSSRLLRPDSSDATLDSVRSTSARAAVDRVVGLDAAPVEILALERQPLERLPHAPRPPADRADPLLEVAHDLELVRDLRVAPLELCGVGERIGWRRPWAHSLSRRDGATAVRRLAA